MCSSLIYMDNSNSQTLTANTATTVSFGNTIRRFGCALSNSGGNVVTSQTGFYLCDIDLGITTGAGSVTVQVYKNDKLIPGTTRTITVADNDTSLAVTIPFVVRDKCGCDSTISCVVTSAVAGTIYDATIRVERV